MTVKFERVNINFEAEDKEANKIQYLRWQASLVDDQSDCFEDFDPVSFALA